MTWIRNAAGEVVALFVDDGSLAIAILTWVAAALLLFPTLHASGAWPAVALFLGLAAILLENVLRTARRRRRP